MSDNELDAILRKYIELRPSYERLVTEVCRILQARLETEGIPPVSVLGRTKEPQSFKEKISRKSYRDPLDQSTDLAGARVVCKYESDLTSTLKVIESNFEVYEHVDKSRDLGVDKMGYNGKSVIVTLGDRYSGFHYDGITRLKCEIQVRTVLQDAWAIIEHQLVYKSEDTIPHRLRRDINNVASLLEIAQGVFDNVREKREAYIAEIQKKSDDRSSFLEQPIDFDTLIAYTAWKYPSLKPSESLSQLALRDINIAKYKKLFELDRIIEQARPAVEAYAKENPAWFSNGTDFITKSLGFVDSDFRKKHPFAPRTREAIERYKYLIRTQ